MEQRTLSGTPHRAASAGDATIAPALRIGVDVGGTFTKAVAISGPEGELTASAVVPTSHAHVDGVTAGVADAITDVLAELGPERHRVALAAFSTTQAMNALLEGDVPRVGIVGIGHKPDLRKARKRSRIGSIGLAPGRALETEHEFLDATAGLDESEARAAVNRLVAAGCGAIAISGAFAVDSPEQELAVAAIAAEHDLPSCCGHELSGAYGLETRTVSAAINAAILPVIERTAGLVESALSRAGLSVPLLVLRGDGGAMDVASFHRRPSLTVGSGPAAGVAAALHRADVSDAIVVECGGTSTNVSVVTRGRPVLRSIRVMGRPTSIRSIDSWVVGVAGGSMIRLGRKGIAGVGPRSAHLAGARYSCFAEPGTFADARVELISPRPGDPPSYVALRTDEGRFALTSTCAATALSLVPADAHAHGSRDAALEAFGKLADHLGRGDARSLAEATLAAGIDEIEAAVKDAQSTHDLGSDVPLLALGGAGEALVPALAQRLGRDVIHPPDQEVLASIGAATTLVRTVRTRSAAREGDGRIELVHSAERACVDAGAAPDTVSVEATYDPDERLMRAVATGAVALERGAAGRTAATPEELARAAATALDADPADLRRIDLGDFYTAFVTGQEDEPRAAVVDRLGSVPLMEWARAVVSGSGEDLRVRLREAVESATTNLGIASVIPRVVVVCGSRLHDLSDARTLEELLAAVDLALDDAAGATAVALVSR